MSWKIKFGFWLAVIGAICCTICFEIRAENTNQKIENEIPTEAFDSEIKVQYLEAKIYPDTIVMDADAIDWLAENRPSREMVLCYEIDDYNRHEITAIVCGEAGGESMEGKMAVAQTIMNSMIYEKTDVNGIRYKFDGYKDVENSNPELWNDCATAVALVFDDGELPIDGEPLFFYAHKNMYSKWHETSPNLKYLCTIGGHKFFGLKNNA